jgi:type II secretory pathway pseudopilin PulG
MIEVIMVMVILGLLLAIALPTYLSSGHAADGKVAQAMALNYRDSVEAFQLEHGNRAPLFGVASDWPTDTVTKTRLGPIDIDGNPYLKEAPEPLTTGQVSLGTKGTPFGKIGRVEYDRLGPTTYTLTVSVLDHGTAVVVCTLGNAPSASENC